ncbi:dihydrolipoyl dehydrogenase [Conexibacter woesei]|uniref:Dihydrolipoyl dehydrogenase n=1 Tax=Conexibacter woesei (strain DSM 14684 / CCUG 47730 / CIP 108061 / JCM 11494 / NBRC 100937 / ID131577) TaxID=469383 RepID=D3F7R6_CONWI|nr:dihydrolipoyl dehydrogenase [Conexibacter woesei]ADB52810.1 dihydrolipoamide dehydrogenase [Conexibacter woesei DSM 14684]
MVVGELIEEVDLLVVGGGPGGYTAALHAAALGRRVTLVEEGGPAALGGACLHVGCIPSKALIEVASHAWRGHELAELGAAKTAGGFDGDRFQVGKAALIARLASGVAGQLANAGVRVVEGRATLTAADRVSVHSGADGALVAQLRFRDAILATGSRPIELPALPYDGVTVLDSAGALALADVPEALAVVGGGYIGLELGIAFAKLGARVSIVEARERLLPELPKALLRPLLKRLAELGVAIHVNALAVGHADGRLRCEQADGAALVDADKVIVAVGRRPNVDGLGLGDAGLADPAGALLAPAPDRRIAEHVAAIGDIVPGPALAHKATAEARVAAEALSGRRVAFDPAAIPLVVFSDPEIASAGQTAAQARDAGVDAIEVVMPLAASGRAATMAATHGFVQLVVDPQADAIIGAHIVAPHASELIAEAVLAIELRASPEDLALTIHPHPTLSELFAEAAERTPATS